MANHILTHPKKYMHTYVKVASCKLHPQFSMSTGKIRKLCKKCEKIEQKIVEKNWAKKIVQNFLPKIE